MAAGDVTATISKPTGKALYFDGINDKVNCGTHEVLNPKNDITITFWVNSLNSIVQGEEIIFKSGQYLARREANHKLTVFLYIGGGWVNQGESTTNINSGSGWKHIAITYNSVCCKIYIDGVIERINNQTGQLGTSTNPLYFCNELFGTFFNGNIDNVRIYNRTLDANEITASYTGKTIGRGLVGYWDFNDPTNPGKDDSGNNNNGTVVGAIEAAGHNTIEDDVKTARVSANDVWGFIPLANNQEIMMAHIEEA